MKYNAQRSVCMVALLALAICECGAAAQEQPPDPQVKAVLNRSMVAYERLHALHLKAVLDFRGDSPSMPQLTASMLMAETVEIWLQRPNKVRIDLVMDAKGRSPLHGQRICDGNTLWDWDSEKNTYTKEPAPKRLRDITVPFTVDDLPGMAWLLGENDVSHSLREKRVFHHPLPRSRDWLRDGRFMGHPLKLDAPSKFAGVNTNVLTTIFSPLPGLMPGMGLTFKFYLGRQDYLFRGMVQETSGKDEKGKTFLFRREVSYPLVDPAPRLSASDFTFVPPPGAKLVTKKVSQKGASSTVH